MSAAILAAAHAAHDAGLSVLPVEADGTKRPAERPWERYQSERMTPAEIERRFADGSYGLAVIGGLVSGGLEWLDFDDGDIYRAWLAAADAAGLGDLVRRIRAGYEEATPGGGAHLAIRSSEPAGNTKLAARPLTGTEQKTLIETRGTGGYAVVAPSNGRVHASGKPYRLVAGSFATIAAVTPEDRRAILALCRTFDERPARNEYQPPSDYARPGSERPGDEFRRTHGTLEGWRSILEPHGWQLVYQRGDVGYWRRPGKDRGISATTGHAGTDLLYVFTSSTAFEPERAYNPFTAYAMLEHGGDYRAAGKALHAAGYGATGDDGVTVTMPGSAATTKSADAPELHEAARYGLAGAVVAAFEPFTESDPAGLLISFLVAYGNAAGPSPHTWVSETRHGVNLGAVTVGATSRSRKGTSWGPIARVFETADPDWLHGRKVSGIGSGESIVWEIRDPSDPKENPKTGETVIEDEGSRDKRLMVQEAEFSGILKVSNRDGSILSEIVRKALDSDSPLRNMVKRSPVKASDPHVSILGHCTEQELLRELSDTAQVNGLANRFMWVYVRRSKLLPDAPRLDYVTAADLGMRVRRALEHARRCGEIKRDEQAGELWRQVYPDLSKDHPGMFGALTARAEAHVLRLSMVYALLDCSNVVRIEHLTAALAFWRYCEESTRYIFGDRTGDPVADRIREALRTSGPLSETDIRDLFGRHQKSDRVQRALETLLTAGMVSVDSVDTGGRPARVWEATR